MKQLAFTFFYFPRKHQRRGNNGQRIFRHDRQLYMLRPMQFVHQFTARGYHHNMMPTRRQKIGQIDYMVFDAPHFKLGKYLHNSKPLPQRRSSCHSQSIEHNY